MTARELAFYLGLVLVRLPCITRDAAVVTSVLAAVGTLGTVVSIATDFDQTWGIIFGLWRSPRFLEAIGFMFLFFLSAFTILTPLDDLARLDLVNFKSRVREMRLNDLLDREKRAAFFKRKR